MHICYYNSILKEYNKTKNPFVELHLDFIVLFIKKTKKINFKKKILQERKEFINGKKVISTTPEPKIDLDSKPKKGFRLSCRKALLTYPNCNLSLLEVEKQIFDKLHLYDIDNYAIVSELHESMEIHFHVLVSVTKKIDTKNVCFLDLKKVIINKDLKEEEIIFHGNYQMMGDKFQTLPLEKRMICLAENRLIAEAMLLLKKIPTNSL